MTSAGHHTDRDHPILAAEERQAEQAARLTMRDDGHGLNPRGMAQDRAQGRTHLAYTAL